MQKKQSKLEENNLSHFEQLDIEILRKQNHNLFQTVNQLRHEVTKLKKQSESKSDQISTGYVHKILKFLLTSFELNKQNHLDEIQPISVNKKNEIIKIISIILDSEKNCQENIKKQIIFFIEGSLKTINQFYDKNIHKENIKSKNFLGIYLAFCVYNFYVEL